MRFLKLLDVALAFGARPAPSPGPSGVSHFQQVDSRVYRGGQPPDCAFQFLAGLGVRTVLDLRESGQAAAEEKLVLAAGMRFVSIPLNDLRAPTAQQIAAALAVLSDDSAAPVFVHCRRGADRTGTVVACYRIAHYGWGNRQALDEARSQGMSLLEPGMRRYILHFRCGAGCQPAAGC